jgi:hypothetical protein
MKNQLISARVELNDYTNRVLGVIKIKFGLKNKSEALNKFIELYGDDVIEKEVSDEYLKKVIAISEDHLKKHKNRRMTLQELNELCGE